MQNTDYHMNQEKINDFFMLRLVERLSRPEKKNVVRV